MSNVPVIYRKGNIFCQKFSLEEVRALVHKVEEIYCICISDKLPRNEFKEIMDQEISRIESGLTSGSYIVA